ncbi:MAG: hypothetical protein KDC05_11005, partial [Bacteroidales bacterium]|nr:hypothetical protein [Bacteroidales bacterium]
MKQLYTKYFIMLMMLCAFISVTNGQIQSLPGGGDWNSIYTWIGGTIPGINDDVIIDGIVECDNGHHCNNLTVLPTGVLRNNYYSGSLTVNGNITNHGGIENYVSNMTLYLKGNVNNNGVWTNSYVRINGTGNQTVTCSNGHTFGGYQFVMEKPSGDFTFDGEVNFDNCQVLLADYTIYLTPGSTINIHDAVFNNCTVMGGGSSSAINGIGTYNADAPEFNYVHFHDLTFTGEINIYNGCSTHGTVYNNAMMQNSYYGAVLSVYDNFINNGTLRNYVSNFTLNVYDHFFNNNVVDNHALDFRGDDDQEVSLAPGKTYSPSYFTSFKATGKIVALTDLRFENVLVNMGSDTLLVPAGGLIHMDDGEFKSGVVAATEPTDFGDLTFHSENGATTNNSTFYNATLTGHFLCSYNNIFRGVTNNNGLMENDYYGLDADIYDHFINNGTIQNYVGNLILNLYGNFVNNGVVENHALDFYGTTDQLVDLLPGEAYSPTYFTSFKPSGKIVASADLVFQQTIIDLNNDTLMLQDDGTLALDGGYINEAVILDENNNTGYLHINFINEAYMSNCTIHNPELLGTVDLNTNNTFIGEVLVTGTARNDYNGYTLTINGNIINNGIIQNYINSLTVNINGHVTNNGIWENSYTHLNGTADQHVTCQNSNWFTGYQFFNSNSSGIVYFDDMVGFHNCQVRIEGNTINLPINSTLYMHGSYLTDCNLIGYNETSVVHGEGTYYVDGPYMQNSTFENISLTGDWGIGTGITFNGSVINNGILQNAYFSYALVVNAVFVNNGTIKSFINNLSMYMYSNFTNNGDWSGYTIDLNSSADQKITLADGKVFNPGYFHSYKPSGKIVALTDLSFVNTYIDINNDTLVLPEGATLSLNNRFLQEAVVNAESGRFNLYMTNEAYLQDCQLFDADLYGTIDLKDNEFFGTTINRGTMRNDYFSYTTDFYGDLINHGTIQNYINSFIIRAHANITNNGIWSNYYTLMEGTSDQYIHLNNGHWIDGQMRIHADISGPWYQWYWNGGAIVSHWPDPDPFSGYTSNTLQFNNPVSANRLGTYNCNVGGVYSRDIIVDQSSTMRLDVKVFMEGPFNGTEMNNTINPLIPLQNSLGIIGYSGPEAVSSIPNADIVDWVGFELRDAPDAASANENTTVGGGAYFLLKDGSIVGLDGNSMPSFDITISNQLFVLVWHRNHLPVMSKYPLTESGG